MSDAVKKGPDPRVQSCNLSMVKQGLPDGTMKSYREFFMKPVRSAGAQNVLEKGSQQNGYGQKRPESAEEVRKRQAKALAKRQHHRS